MQLTVHLERKKGGLSFQMILGYMVFKFDSITRNP